MPFLRRLVIQRDVTIMELSSNAAVPQLCRLITKQTRGTPGHNDDMSILAYSRVCVSGEWGEARLS